MVVVDLLGAIWRSWARSFAFPKSTSTTAQARPRQMPRGSSQTAHRQLEQLRYQQSLVLGRQSWVSIFKTLNAPPKDLQSPPKQWVFISSVPENDVVAHDLHSLFLASWSVSKTLAPLELPHYDRDLDAPKFEGKALPGITDSIGRDDLAADFIASSLANCYSIRRASEMPAGAVEYYLRTNPTWITGNDVFTWLEVGKGSPWQANACGGPGN